MTGIVVASIFLSSLLWPCAAFSEEIAKLRTLLSNYHHDNEAALSTLK